ncbi:MAG: nitroreductase family protein [Dehalococcoidia bacterium]
MDAFTSIRTKRDTRAYLPRPILDETLHRILQAGRMAGSSKNTQPCRFVVVRDEAQKRELADCGQWATHVPAAPVVVAVILTPGGGAFDAGRSAQNMMIAAWAEGITSCPTSMHNEACAARVLNLPPEHRGAIVLPLAYPDSSATARRGHRRLPLEEFVHWEHWKDSSE